VVRRSASCVVLCRSFCIYLVKIKKSNPAPLKSQYIVNSLHTFEIAVQEFKLAHMWDSLVPLFSFVLTHWGLKWFDLPNNWSWALNNTNNVYHTCATFSVRTLRFELILRCMDVQYLIYFVKSIGYIVIFFLDSNKHVPTLCISLTHELWTICVYTYIGT